MEWIDTGVPDVLAFRRGGRFACATSFGEAAWHGPDGATAVLASSPKAPTGPATVWYRLR
jgi:hypothetical protein